MNKYTLFIIILIIWNIIIIIKKKRKVNKERITEIKNFNLGSSHSLCAFSKNLKNNVNLAENSQTFYYDYKILSRYFNIIQEGGVCFLSISYFSFASKEYWIKTDLFKYYKILKITDFSGRAKLECIIYRYFPLIWSIYKKIIKEKKIEDSKKYLGHVKKLEENRNLEWNINILNNIIEKCKEKSVKIVFLTTPFRRKYNEYFSEELLRNNFYMIINKIAKKNSILYLDFSHDYLNYDDSKYFRDLDHLSELGSEKFLKQLKKELERREIYI